MLALLAPLPAAAGERIVVAAGALTEIVYALGADRDLVGVDSTSRYPDAASALPKIGYMRALSVEGVLSLRPTLMIAAADAGPPPVLAQLRAAGLRVVTIPDDHSPAGVVAKIRLVADALGRRADGAALAQRIEQGFGAAAALVARARDRPRVMFVLSLGRGAPLASGRDTAADAMIRLAGGANALEAFRGFKPVSAEAASAAAPAVLLAMSQTVANGGGRDRFLAVPQIALTPAGRTGRLVALDGTFLLGFGPRTPQAVCALAAALHPALATDAQRCNGPAP